MARSDSLRLLLIAECRDLPAVEATLKAITARLDVLAEGGPEYVAAHRRIDELLSQREQLLTAARRDVGDCIVVALEHGAVLWIERADEVIEVSQQMLDLANEHLSVAGDLITLTASNLTVVYRLDRSTYDSQRQTYVATRCVAVA